MDERRKGRDTNEITAEYFDQILIEMRHFDGATPDLTLNLYGETFSTPIMMAALSHLKGQNSEGDGMVQMAQAAKMLNSVNWAGMGSIEQFNEICATGAKSIKIIKPYADENEVLSRIEAAEAAGALAVGMDLDHSFSSKGTPDVVLGQLMRPRTFHEIEGYVKRTKLPFIIKGVLSPVDAQKCVDAGVQGIVVSHHHGILPSVVPPLMVLPAIAEVVAGRFPIFADCGIYNGTDAFKALALGATAVSVGRPVMQPIIEKGAEGAKETIEAITTELRSAMARTACKTLSDINKSLLWHADGTRF